MRASASGNQVIGLDAAIDMFLRDDPSLESNQGSPRQTNVASGRDRPSSGNTTITAQGHAGEDSSPRPALESDRDQTDPGMPDMIPVNQNNREQSGPGEGRHGPLMR